MKISLKKLNSIVYIALLITIQFIIFHFIQNEKFNTDEALRIASAICIISFIFCVFTWIKISNELLCPYFVFYCVLFIFCCGQSIGWFFGIDMGPKDMWNRVDHGMTRQLLLKGLCYSTLGITFFHLGAILAYKRKIKNKIEAKKVEMAFRGLGKVLLFICVPAFFAKTFEAIIAVVQGGYSSFYTYKQTSSMFMRLCSMLGDYYQPCLLILLIAYRQEKRKRRLIIFAMMLDVIANLYIGGRSSAVMVILAIVLAYHYYIRPFKMKEVAIGVIGGYFGIGMLNAISDIRIEAGRGISDIVLTFFSSLSNVVGRFIGELGWSITSICWTMDLVPNSYPFRYGMSYIVSFVSWMPSFCFPNGHPVVKWGELSNWLQTSLNMSYGPGYTMIAEAYLNFGYFGYIALLLEGFIVASVISRVSRKNTNDNLLRSTFQLMVIMVIMKSLVRSSVSIAFRQIFLVLLPLYILIILKIKGKVH